MIKVPINLHWNIPYLISQISPGIEIGQYYCTDTSLVITNPVITQAQVETAVRNYSQADANTFQEGKVADEAVERLDSDPVLRAIIEVLIAEINDRKRPGATDLTIAGFAQSLKDKMKEVVRPRFPQAAPGAR